MLPLMLKICVRSKATDQLTIADVQMALRVRCSGSRQEAIVKRTRTMAAALIRCTEEV